MYIIKKIKKSIFLRYRKKKYIQNATEIYKLINNENFELIDQPQIKKVKTITFIIPDMVKYSGGRTSILRLGTCLSNEGYLVSYIPYRKQPVEEMKCIAKSNLSSYKGEFIDNSNMGKISSDIVIATNWQSVYFAKKCNGYKMYFVQDYEPYFHIYGELFLLAKKTYELGFHIVSLGAWNKYKIEKECNVKHIDVIDFPYESKEYTYVNRNYNNFDKKNSYKIAVYIKNDGKRLPIIIQIMLKEVQKLFVKDNKKLEILFFGLDNFAETLVGTNLGKLNKNELQKLYQVADFGMVASMSNISLVPYEMIATGLPLIEFEEGTFKYFFKEGSAILTSFNYMELYQKLKYYINNPTKIEIMQEIAFKQLRDLSWNKTGKQFSKIIEEIF